MAIYVNGVPVNECEGVYVNGQIAQNVYVNGVNAYTSRCCSDFVYSGNSYMEEANWVCPDIQGTVWDTNLETSGNAIRDSFFYAPDNGWYFGDWIYAGGCGVGQGISRPGDQQVYPAFNYLDMWIQNVDDAPNLMDGYVNYDNIDVKFIGYSEGGHILGTLHRVTAVNTLQADNGLMRKGHSIYCSVFDAPFPYPADAFQWGGWISAVPIIKVKD